MIYLYIKTHNITGLKYLGQTKKNPFKYQGSGRYWSNHITKHGYNVTTEIIYESNFKNDIVSAGIYYSLFYNVVNSKEWANEVEECGQGGYNLLAHKSTLFKIKNKTHHFYDIEKQKERSVKGNKVLCDMWMNGIHPRLIRINSGIDHTKIKWICEFCGKNGTNKTNYVRHHGKNCKIKL